MSRVFLAEETALQRKVVIKVLPAELAAEVNAERFRREIQLAAKLQHPYIVPVLTTGVAGGLPYFTMPFIEGESLRSRLLKTGEFPVPEAIGIMRDVLEALAYAHESGVVHRDIKPENVLLARNHAHVADFGVAKALSASTDAQSGLTSLGVALGTPAYMAPEQAMADPSTDHRADLYAVGAMAYEMLTGYQVFSARSPQAMLAAHAVEAPEPIGKRRPNVPPPLANLIMRLLDKHPADRPQTANEALSSLAAATTPSGGMAATAQYATTEPVPTRKSRRGMTAGVAIVVGIAILAGYLAAHRRPSNDSAAEPKGPSIAVMPFENMSGDPHNDYLGDGLSEELIGGLSRVRGLQVAARTSSFALRGKNEDVKSIGKKLGVNSVLAGSVRRAGNKLRVAVQLTSVSSGYNLWSETYDRDMSDVFAVEDEISKAIVSALEVRLAGGKSAGAILEKTTSDPEAYDFYLRGRFAFNQRGLHLLDAEKLYKQAIARDSSFALAWSALATVYMTEASWGIVTPVKALALALPLAEKAALLAPSIAEPHVALGSVHCQLQHDVADGIKEFHKAEELNPNLGEAHYFASVCSGFGGNATDALREALIAERLEPLNAQFVSIVARAYLLKGDLKRAVETGLRAQAMNPNLGSTYAVLTWIYASMGDTANMRAQLIGSVPLMAANGVGVWSTLAIVTHDSARLTHERSEALRRPEAAAIYIAGGYAFVRNADSTLAWLDKAFAVNGDVIGIVHYPLFDWLRPDPRFKEIQKKYAVPDVRR